MNGYKEAKKIDDRINELLQEYKIEDHGEEWWKLSRTLKTSMEIIEEKSMDIVSAETRRMACPEKPEKYNEFKP